jgi:PKD repeat protein
MKKAETPRLLRTLMQITGIFAVIFLFSCDKDDPPEPAPADAVASFQYAISETNFMEVAFTNYSQNAESYSWNFGDANTSTDENPVHVYAEPGNYDVVLTATNSANKSHTFSRTIEIKDPDVALVLLAGETSKTWKLYRVDQSMGVGPSVDDPYNWWSLTNDGSRPCVYEHEFTFLRDGTYEFEHNGGFWGEAWKEGLNNTCFEATPANMVNANGDDVSAWLNRTHSFEYNPATGMVTIIGEGAWIGLPKTATDGEVSVPQQEVSFRVDITEHDGYDLMVVRFLYPGDEDVHWRFNYVNYSDASLEPDLVTETAVVPPLGKITPTEMFITFAADDAAEKATIDVVPSGSTVDFGVDDPLDATAAKVGQFNRTDAQYQELQFRAAPEPKDILFDNFTEAKVDIYIPADTDFTTGMKRKIVLGFADQSHTPEWWTGHTQFELEGDDVVLGAWETYTFDLTDVKVREDIDMIFLQIGDGGHTTTGTFFVRNLIFN